MNFHQHSFKKEGTPSLLAGQCGQHKWWGCFWNHSLCAHGAALTTRVTPLPRGGGISPAACPVFTRTHILTDPTQQLPDLEVPTLSPARAPEMVGYVPRQPHAAAQAVVGRAEKMAVPSETFMMWLIFSSTKLALTKCHQWSDLQQVTQIAWDLISSSLKWV